MSGRASGALLFAAFLLVAVEHVHRRRVGAEPPDAGTGDVQGPRHAFRQLLDEHRRLMDGARVQANELLAEGRKAAERLRAELLEEAKQQKKQIVARAGDDIRRERDQALAALRRSDIQNLKRCKDPPTSSVRRSE